MRVLLLMFAAVSTLVPGLAQMGSPGGGETQAIALHPTDPGTLYAGAAKGLCKTTSGGKNNWPSSGLEALSPRAIVLDRSSRKCSTWAPTRWACTSPRTGPGPGIQGRSL